MLNPARIAKNTIFLYVRMIFVLAANFLAVRVLLDVLGVEDFGLFNLIVGFVTLFTFLNGAMLSTVQRFLCFELGKCEKSSDRRIVGSSDEKEQMECEQWRDDIPLSTSNLQPQPSLHPQSPTPASQTRLIFTLCFWLFAALALLIVLVSETGGLWFVCHKLNIPPARFHSAQVVYQLSIVVMVFKTMQIPYTALIISYERMNAFAKISIVEAVLTLGAALAIKWMPGDNLIVYTVLYTIAQSVVCLTYVLYCRRHFSEGRILSLFSGEAASSPLDQKAKYPIFITNRSLLKKLSSFFSWSILGAVANMLKQQGLNVLLNIFFGVAFNATWAIANKIGMAVNQLVGNFQQAFNPQIVKLYAEEDKRQYYALVSNASRYSFLLLWFFALPLMVDCEFFLKIWLKGELPPQLVIFVSLSVVFMLCEAIAAPFWMAIQATGSIAVYQTVVSFLISLTLPIGWAVLELGAPACSILIANIVLSLACHIFRMCHLGVRTGFMVWNYILHTMVPIVLVALLSLGFVAIVRQLVQGFASNVIIELAIVSMCNAIIVIFMGCTSLERAFIVNKLSSKLSARRSINRDNTLS